MTKRKGWMFGKIRGTSTTPSVRGQSAMQSMKNMTKFSSISLQFHFPVFHFKLLISYFHDASNQWKNKSIYIYYILIMLFPIVYEHDRLWVIFPSKKYWKLSTRGMWNLKIMTQVIYHEAYGFLEIKKTAIWKKILKKCWIILKMPFTFS